MLRTTGPASTRQRCGTRPGYRVDVTLYLLLQGRGDIDPATSAREPSGSAQLRYRSRTPWPQPRRPEGRAGWSQSRSAIVAGQAGSVTEIDRSGTLFDFYDREGFLPRKTESKSS